VPWSFTPSTWDFTIPRRNASYRHWIVTGQPSS
jgi:hypothetical protein